MKLRMKITLALLGVVAVFAIGSYFALSATLIPAFDELEQRAANQDMARTRSGVEAYSGVLSYTTIDWGQWDETYTFMQGTNPDFESENLEAGSLEALSLNVMAFYDLDNGLYWGMFVDSETGQGHPLTDSIIGPRANMALLSFGSISDETVGFISSELGPMLVSARPVVRSDATGPAVGTLIAGRLLDESSLAQLRETSKVAISLTATKADDLATLSATDSQMFSAPTQYTTEQDRITRQVIHDIHGAPIAALMVTSPRSITGLQKDTISSLFGLFVGLGALIVIGLWQLLSLLVVKPVSELREAMIAVEEGGDLSDRVSSQRSDEIGDLANAYDTMLQQLHDARRQHIDQSFKAGMAEVAAGVLHNVRNSLMPVLNNVAIARDAAAYSAGKNVRRAEDELLSGNAANERREKLLHYLHAARERTEKEHAAIGQHLDLANEQLDKVVDILRDQEQYTHAEPVLEKINLAELVHEAAAVIPENENLDVTIEIDEELFGCTVHAHRIGLLQVFNNLLLNAHESITRAKMLQGLISVFADIEHDSDEDQVRITVRDTGLGIEPESLEHIFDRGFSSKGSGRGGLGLHWSANALASMRGEISAFSSGLGQGAEFHITLKAA
jgi:sensor domain CHASE-containing protein